MLNLISISKIITTLTLIYIAFAPKLFSEDNDVYKLIHGHTHRPAIHEHRLKQGIGLRYVLGDWRPSTTFLLAKDTNYELKKFNFRV